jgi:hypothetical protein
MRIGWTLFSRPITRIRSSSISRLPFTQASRCTGGTRTTRSRQGSTMTSESAWSLERVRLLITEKVRERQDLEFKESLPAPGKNEGIGKIVSAMANSGGGTIVYGIVEDDQSRAGAASNPAVSLEGTPERIAEVARNAVDEPVAVETLSLEDAPGTGRGFLVVLVPGSDRVPHFADHVAWSRADIVTYRMSRKEIGALFARSSGFAEEFHLKAGSRPPHVVGTLKRQTHSPSRRLLLVFTNLGDTAAKNVDIQFKSAKAKIRQPTALPIPSLQPAAPYQVPVEFDASTFTPSVEVAITWEDEDGRNSNEEQTLSRPYE